MSIQQPDRTRGRGPVLVRVATKLRAQHEWLELFQAKQLLAHALLALKLSGDYPPDLLPSLMQAEFGSMVNMSEAELRNRLAIAQEFIV